VGNPDENDSANSEHITAAVTIAGAQQEPIDVNRSLVGDPDFAAIDLNGPIVVERSAEFHTSVQVKQYMWISVRVGASVRVHCGPNQQIFAGEVLQTRAINDALEGIHVAAALWKDEAHKIRERIEGRTGGGE